MSTKMSLQNIQRGRTVRPIRMSLYGVDGIGKTTFTAAAPNPIFINAEDGQGVLDIARFPTPATWEEILDAIDVLYEGEHDYQSLVLDSTDWAESLCMEAVCVEHGVTGIESLGYGKGYKFAREKFAKLFRALDALWSTRNMHIFLISHCQVKKFDDPEREAYDRYILKLDEQNAAKLREWCDINAFANYDTVIKQVGEGLNQAKRAVSYGKRQLFLERTAAFDAKNRFDLPPKVIMPKEDPFGPFWDAYQNAIGGTQAAA